VPSPSSGLRSQELPAARSCHAPSVTRGRPATRPVTGPSFPLSSFLPHQYAQALLPAVTVVVTVLRRSQEKVSPPNHWYNQSLSKVLTSGRYVISLHKNRPIRMTPWFGMAVAPPAV